MNKVEMCILGVTFLIAFLLWLFNKLKDKSTKVVDSIAPIYVRGKFVKRFKYLTDQDGINDGTFAKAGTLKGEDTVSGITILTEPYPDLETEDGNIVYYSIIQGKKTGAIIDKIEIVFPLN